MTVSSESNQNITPRKKLENHLRQLLDEERFFDISLKCSDNVILRACKNILSVRSEVFNERIFEKSKESINQSKSQLEFNQINSIAMKFILEYLYTSVNEREKLDVDKVIEVYYSAIHFDLEDLQGDIIEFVKKTLREREEDLGKKLLSCFIEKFSLKADNILGRILVDWVAKIQLFPDDAGRDSLSLEGLQYLLCKTYKTEKSFATYELTLLEYTLIKTKQIASEGNVGSNLKPFDMNGEPSVLEQIKNRLKPLLEYIDLCIIDQGEIEREIEPMDVFSKDTIIKAYRRRVETDKPIRGCLIFKWKNFDKDMWQAENKLFVTNNGFTVRADPDLKIYKSIMGDLLVKGNGIHNWDILIEKLNETMYIGICGIGDIDDKFDKPGGKNFQGSALCSDGYLYNKNDYQWYGTKFKEGDVINVLVNMNIKQCFFSINNVPCKEVHGNGFPDKVYPFVTLKKGSKLRVISY